MFNSTLTMLFHYHPHIVADCLASYLVLKGHVGQLLEWRSKFVVLVEFLQHCGRHVIPDLYRFYAMMKAVISIDNTDLNFLL